MNYTECLYFEAKDTTSWHNDVFAHLDYNYYCHKEGFPKEILWPLRTCSKCKDFKKASYDKNIT